MGKHDICIAAKEKLVKDSGVAEEIAYDNIVLKLLTKPRARGKWIKCKIWNNINIISIICIVFIICRTYK